MDFQTRARQRHIEGSLNGVALHNHVATVESQSAERLSYGGDVAPPTRIPVNSCSKSATRRLRSNFYFSFSWSVVYITSPNCCLNRRRMRLRDWRTVASDMFNSFAISLEAMPSTTERQNACQVRVSNSLCTCDNARDVSCCNCRSPVGSSSGMGTGSITCCIRPTAVEPPDALGDLEFRRNSLRQAARTSLPVPATPEHPAATHAAAGWIGLHCWIGPSSSELTGANEWLIW